MFPNKFVVSDIYDILHYSCLPDEPQVVAFTGALGCNELIFQLSGENVVFFNGKRMNMRPNYIRFLPEGEVSQYIVKRDKYGDWYLWYNGRKGSKELIGLVIKKGPDIFE